MQTRDGYGSVHGDDGEGLASDIDGELTRTFSVAAAAAAAGQRPGRYSEDGADFRTVDGYGNGAGKRGGRIMDSDGNSERYDSRAGHRPAAGTLAAAVEESRKILGLEDEDEHDDDGNHSDQRGGLYLRGPAVAGRSSASARDEDDEEGTGPGVSSSSMSRVGSGAAGAGPGGREMNRQEVAGRAVGSGNNLGMMRYPEGHGEQERGEAGIWGPVGGLRRSHSVGGGSSSLWQQWTRAAVDGHLTNMSAAAIANAWSGSGTSSRNDTSADSCSNHDAGSRTASGTRSSVGRGVNSEWATPSGDGSQNVLADGSPIGVTGLKKTIRLGSDGAAAATGGSLNGTAHQDDAVPEVGTDASGRVCDSSSCAVTAADGVGRSCGGSGSTHEGNGSKDSEMKNCGVVRSKGAAEAKGSPGINASARKQSDHSHHSGVMTRNTSDSGEDGLEYDRGHGTGCVGDGSTADRDAGVGKKQHPLDVSQQHEGQQYRWPLNQTLSTSVVNTSSSSSSRSRSSSARGLPAPQTQASDAAPISSSTITLPPPPSIPPSTNLPRGTTVVDPNTSSTHGDTRSNNSANKPTTTTLSSSATEASGLNHRSTGDDTVIPSEHAGEICETHPPPVPPTPAGASDDVQLPAMPTKIYGNKQHQPRSSKRRKLAELLHFRRRSSNGGSSGSAGSIGGGRRTPTPPPPLRQAESDTSAAALMPNQSIDSANSAEGDSVARNRRAGSAPAGERLSSEATEKVAAVREAASGSGNGRLGEGFRLQYEGGKN